MRLPSKIESADSLERLDVLRDDGLDDPGVWAKVKPTHALRRATILREGFASTSNLEALVARRQESQGRETWAGVRKDWSSRVIDLLRRDIAEADSLEALEVIRRVSDQAGYLERFSAALSMCWWSLINDWASFKVSGMT